MKTYTTFPPPHMVPNGPRSPRTGGTGKGHGRFQNKTEQSISSGTGQ